MFSSVPSLYHEARRRSMCDSLAGIDLVRPIHQMVMSKSLEKFCSFQVMAIASLRRLGLTRPVDDDVLIMTISEGLPEWTLGSGVSSVMKSLHQVRQTFYSL